MYVDVRKIVASNILPDAVASNIARIANLKASKVVTAPSGNKALLTQAAEVETNHYVDPINQTVFSVDHLT
ncbi:MAG: hypothetical protein EOO89_24400, partial [Pedobacter sp.]